MIPLLVSQHQYCCLFCLKQKQLFFDKCLTSFDAWHVEMIGMMSPLYPPQWHQHHAIVSSVTMSASFLALLESIMHINLELFIWFGCMTYGDAEHDVSAVSSTTLLVTWYCYVCHWISIIAGTTLKKSDLESMNGNPILICYPCRQLTWHLLWCQDHTVSVPALYQALELWHHCTWNKNGSQLITMYLILICDHHR